MTAGTITVMEMEFTPEEVSQLPERSAYWAIAKHYEKLATPGSFAEEECRFYKAMDEIITAKGNLSAVLDTGGLNDFIKAYCAVAMSKAKVDSKTRRQVMDSLNRCLDEMTAEEVFRESENRTR